MLKNKNNKNKRKEEKNRKEMGLVLPDTVIGNLTKTELGRGLRTFILHKVLRNVCEAHWQDNMK